MNSLIPFAGKQVAKLQQAGAVTTNALAPAVKQAMRELIVCYSAPGESTEDRALVLQVWAREVASYMPEIVAEAMLKLLRENPRAPFRPCVKDVLDYCCKVQSKHVRVIAAWYLGWSDDEPPAWVQSMVRKVLENEMKDISTRYDPPSEYESALDMLWGITRPMHRGWKLAQTIGKRLADWPEDLLAEHGVLTGARLQDVSDRVARQLAEQESNTCIRGEVYAAAERTCSKVTLALEYTEHHARAVWDEVARHPHLYPELAKDPRAKLIEEAA
jgi:hypothetical protein